MEIILSNNLMDYSNRFIIILSNGLLLISNGLFYLMDLLLFNLMDYY